MENVNLGLEEFRSRLAEDASRRALGLRLRQDDALELLSDDAKVRAAFIAFRTRTNQGNPTGGPTETTDGKFRLTFTGWQLLVSFLVMPIGLTLLLVAWQSAAGHIDTYDSDCTRAQLGGIRCATSVSTWVADGYSITLICLAVLGGLLALFGIAVFLAKDQAAPARTTA